MKVGIRRDEEEGEGERGIIKSGKSGKRRETIDRGLTNSQRASSLLDFIDTDVIRDLIPDFGSREWLLGTPYGVGRGKGREKYK